MAISKCTISVNLKNLSDAVPADLEATLVLRNQRTFFHGDSVIGPFKLEANFNGSGVASIEVIETETPAVKLDAFIILTEGVSKRIIRFQPFEVPNEASANLNELTQVDAFSTF